MLNYVGNVFYFDKSANEIESIDKFIKGANAKPSYDILDPSDAELLDIGCWAIDNFEDSSLKIKWDLTV